MESAGRDRMRRIVFAVAVTAILAMAGCVSFHTYSVRCAWCSSPIMQRTYAYDMVAQTIAVSGTATFIGRAPNVDAAQDVMKKDVNSFVTAWHDQFAFCSLRCLNAYLASTGIKEQRTRIIQGE